MNQVWKMKKTAVFSMLSMLAHFANAQSSVTLYGIVDEGFEAVSNSTASGSSSGARLYRLDGTAGLKGSRWGLRGNEELGGGTQAIFLLENGFDPSSGRLAQGGTEFGRQAFVGLNGDRYGTVTFGRQYDSVVEYLGRLGFSDSNVGTTHSAHPADIDNFKNSRRTNNAVKFQSLDYAGLAFGGLYSFGGVPGSPATNRLYSLGAGYKRGPVSLGVAYLDVRNPSASLFGSNASDTPTSNGLTTSPIFSGYASASTYQVAGVAGSYTLGATVLGFTYSNIRFGNIGKLGNASASFSDEEVSIQHHITSRLLAGIAYNHLHGSAVRGTIGGADYNQFAIGVDYTLSSRTDVYLAAAYQKANGHDSTGRPAVANLADESPSSNGHQAVTRIGLRHTF
jgi:predicted porin